MVIFFKSKIANYFYSMTAVGLGQQGSQVVGPGSSICRGKYLYALTFVRNYGGYHGTVGKTTRF